jgi:hypothetical protein
VAAKCRISIKEEVDETKGNSKIAELKHVLRMRIEEPSGAARVFF